MDFRDDFILAKRSESLGRVSLSPRRAVAWAAVSFLVGAVLALVGIFTIKYSEYETASGYVAEYGFKSTISSSLPLNGILSEIYVNSGDSLIPGRAVARIKFRGDVPQTQFINGANSFFFVPDPAGAEKRDSAVISTTVSGKVENILVREGVGISPMQPIVTVSTSEHRTYFQVLASSSAINSLAIGKRLSVSLPDVNLPQSSVMQGKVVEISRASLSPLEISSLFGVPPPSSSKFLVNIVPIKPLTGDEIKLIRPGMNVVASIKKRERTIASWIFQP
ncbi:hypothetical protein [Xanthomonas vesicatoria]|uniref:HlyD family secretion protein n=1 Tax=Xanthomonas vesicatoria TaxID=56460 RepID=A0ABS8LFR8_9XANT|nr:hypothetical protein [Xanthomonas vesicatoria]MCC8624579.1 hypothetical protein [Xanthomonas vesicatoria]MCC8693455.1 hypothetical protein [Xanthomonas vesicatoria]MCC8703721.1 hypothetical protein [Xanthomonas vesicatoria]MDG4489858.1 hypothetical protein [Xanthomonas vesicatoria]